MTAAFCDWLHKEGWKRNLGAEKAGKLRAGEGGNPHLFLGRLHEGLLVIEMYFPKHVVFIGSCFRGQYL